MDNEVKLKRHNLDTYNIIKETYKEKNHIGVVQATGTGKSFLMAKSIQDMGFERVLFLAPSLHIINQFRNNFSFLEDNIVFMTYKKMTYIKDIEKFLKENDFDFVILDEYHRCGARTWEKPIKKVLSYYKDKKVLGLTATPVRYLDSCRDMTKELFDSEPIVEIPLLDAIDEKILPKPKYILSCYNVKEEISVLNEKIKFETDEDIMRNISYLMNNLESLDNVEQVIEKNITTERKFIVFCSNINHAKEISSIVKQWFNNIGFKVKKYFVYADNKNSEIGKNQKKILDSFKNSQIKENEVHLLFSINILNEGVHIDDVDGLIFLRKTISPIILYQQLGRVLSSGSKKTPIVFDFVNNIDRLSFIGKRQIKDDNKNKQLKLDLNLNLRNIDYSLNGLFEVIDYTKELNDLLKTAELLSINSSWKAFITSLKEYKESNGHCNVPSMHYLYKRCLRIRKDYARGILNPKEIEELNELGFKWEIGTYNEDTWNKMFEELVEFVKENNHANVPRNHTNKKLATWVHTQRKLKDSITEERREKLLSIGFEFEIRQKKNDLEWEAMFNQLLEFKAKLNHVNVSSRYEDKKLANWVNSQRKAYKANKIDEMRYRRLIDVGFVFPEKNS